MDATEGLLVGARRALVSLGDSVGAVLKNAPDRTVLASARRRGHFRPTEEDSLLGWFAHFLTVRDGLWEVVEEVSRPVRGNVKGILDETGWRCFVLGYAAACRIVRLDRLLLEDIATDSAVQRKLYNFDFDFFRSDRLVCTEVVYRAFDGLGSIRIPLHERSGRPTLSAEDLLDLALAAKGFDPIAVCGPLGCPPGLTVAPDAADAIRASYR